jgi:hypothetical protein
MAEHVVLHGGPFESEPASLFFATLVRFHPDHFCAADPDTGGWHHYVHEPEPGPDDDPVGRIVYVYVGPCAALPEHDCGHDHRQPVTIEPPSSTLLRLRNLRHRFTRDRDRESA